MVHVATIVNVMYPRSARISLRCRSPGAGRNCRSPSASGARWTCMAWSWKRLIVACSSTGGGAHRREPSGKRVLQGVHDRERTPVLEQDVVEAAQRMAGQGRQHAEHEVIQQQVEEVPRERGKGVLRELVVKGLVAHRSVREGIEDTQDVASVCVLWHDRLVRRAMAIRWGVTSRSRGVNPVVRPSRVIVPAPKPG